MLTALASEARSATPLAERGWRVQLCGMGPDNARRAAQQLLDAGIRRLLVWGIAGGLDATTKPGDLFIPRSVVNAADRQRFPVTESWHAQLAASVVVPGTEVISRGALLTVAEIVETSAAKQALASDYGALMVDMEAAAVAEVALRASAEFAVVRALADAADVRLPPSVLSALITQHPHRSLMKELLKRPQDLPAVLHLGRSFQHAHRSLTAAALAIAGSRAP